MAPVVLVVVLFSPSLWHTGVEMLKFLGYCDCWLLTDDELATANFSAFCRSVARERIERFSVFHVSPQAT